MDIEESSFAQPLQVPPSYEQNGSVERQLVFALADLGEGTADEVAEHWVALDNSLTLDVCRKQSRKVLNGLFEKGLVNGFGNEPSRKYNLVKETKVHRGKVTDI